MYCICRLDSTPGQRTWSSQVACFSLQALQTCYARMKFCCCLLSNVRFSFHGPRLVVAQSKTYSCGLYITIVYRHFKLHLDCNRSFDSCLNVRNILASLKRSFLSCQELSVIAECEGYIHTSLDVLFNMSVIWNQ